MTLLAALGRELPPADRAPEVFAGAYERGADGITAGRRERKDVPVLDEPMEELDNSFDALVAEAPRAMQSAWTSSMRRASVQRVDVGRDDQLVQVLSLIGEQADVELAAT